MRKPNLFKMKTLILLSVIVLCIASCDSTDDSTTAGSTSNENNTIIETEEQDNDTGKQIELSNDEHKLLLAVRADYKSVKLENGVYTNHENCALDTYDFEINRMLDDVKFWQIVWLNEIYEVHKVTGDTNKLVIECSEETTFYFTKKENVYELIIGGYTDSFYVATDEQLKKLNHIPCTDREALLDLVSGAWFELVERNALLTVVEFCEEAPIGFDIEDGFLDIRYGGDPFPIQSIKKSHEIITITYLINEESGKLKFHNFSGITVQIGEGNSDDSYYVLRENRDQFETYEEPCD